MASSNRKTLMSLIDNKVASLPPEEAFLIDLKTTVARCNPDRPSSPYYKPSSLGCMRIMYFDAIQAPHDPSVPDYNGVRICETGSASHESIQGYVSRMREAGIDCDYVDVGDYVRDHHLDYLIIKNKRGFETKLFDTRYNLSFLCDGIIKYKGKYFILEIKTETDSKGFNRKEADPVHINQVTAYSLSLQLNDVMWIYEERNFCEPKVYHSVITDDMRTALIMRIETVDQAVKDMIPPEKPTSGKWCNYCAYKSLCRKY